MALQARLTLNPSLHSIDLCQAVQLKIVVDVSSLLHFLPLLIQHTASSQIPTVIHAHRIARPAAAQECVTAKMVDGDTNITQPASLPALDSWYAATLASSVQRAASSSVGQSFLQLIQSTFPQYSAVTQIPLQIHKQRRQPAVDTQQEAQQHTTNPQQVVEYQYHYAPLFGYVLSLLDLRLSVILHMYMYTTLRGCLSAAVRLGVIGPREAQYIQANQGGTWIRTAIETWSDSQLQDTTGLFIIDAIQQTHQRLYTRLFTS